MDQPATTPDGHFGAAVRARRAELGITMEQLAIACGVSRGTLSRIENSTLSTSLANAVAIADALGTELSALLALPPVSLVRAGQGQSYTDRSGITRTALARPSAGVELIGYEVPPGTSSAGFAAHPDRTTETIHVLTGSIIYRVGEQEFALRSGDTLTARADCEHQFTNPGRKPCTLQMIIAAPR